MPDIFISYASQDKTRIKPVAEALAAEGWTVFWDRTIKPGENWHKVIGHELKASRCVVVAWSKTSVESDWVLEEAVAGKQRKALIPLSLDEVEIPFGFGQLQSANLKDWDGQSISAEFRELKAAITDKIGPASKNPDRVEPVEPSRTVFAPAESAGQGEQTVKPPIEAVPVGLVEKNQPVVQEASVRVKDEVREGPAQRNPVYVERKAKETIALPPTIPRSRHKELVKTLARIWKLCEPLGFLRVRVFDLIAKILRFWGHETMAFELNAAITDKRGGLSRPSWGFL